MTPTTLYRMFGAAGQLLYVGISSRALSRWEQHRHEKPWWSAVARITVEHFATREEALSAELAAIRVERPEYNIVGTVRPVVSVPELRGARWRELVTLEPRLLELQAQIGSPLCGCESEPLCSWYGLCLEIRPASFKSRLNSLIGAARGRGWAWPEPARRQGPILLRDVVEPAGLAEFRAGEVAQGLGDLWACWSHDVAYRTLNDALPWSSARRTA